MKTTICRLLFPLLALTSVAFGAATPAIDVSVSNPGGKVVYKGKTSAAGTFATGKLEPGQYVVQFNSKNAPGAKGSKFVVVVSAGKRKVSADSVAGEKFAAGGVAMKVDVAAGLNVTGQVAAAGGDVRPGMVWIQPQLGSNLPGHWVPEGSAEAVMAKHSTTRVGKKEIEKMTENSYNPQGN